MISRKGDKRIQVSYTTLRRTVGVLGVLLPVVVATMGFVFDYSDGFQPSISSYYALRTRDVFVGILFAIAWFLFAYRGYDDKDNYAGHLACLLALGVALFPSNGATWERIVHYGSAMGLFMVLAYFSLFLFTLSKGRRTPEKDKRNRLYRICGVAILVCIALIPLYQLLLADTAIAWIRPVFWLEAFALWAFGVSWFVKGETLLKDADRRSEETT